VKERVKQIVWSENVNAEMNFSVKPLWKYTVHTDCPLSRTQMNMFPNNYTEKGCGEMKRLLFREINK